MCCCKKESHEYRLKAQEARSADLFSLYYKLAERIDALEKRSTASGEIAEIRGCLADLTHKVRTSFNGSWKKCCCGCCCKG